MSYISLDTFIEAFAAKLVQLGQRSVRLNDAHTRDNLLSVYEYIEDKIKQEQARPDVDRDLLRSLVNIRNVFKPSVIGAFDEFEALMRAKQDSLTEHPNPYYQDIVIRLSVASARKIDTSLDSATRKLVEEAVGRYASAEHAR